MKYLIIFICLLFASITFADDLILNDPQQTEPAEATRIDHTVVIFDVNNHFLWIEFLWRDENGVIYRDGKYKFKEFFRNRPDNPDTDPEQCIGSGDPYSCCTGAYPIDPNDGCIETNFDMEFNNICGKQATYNSVTKSICKHLRDIIWQEELRPRLIEKGLLDPTNDGSFSD